MTKLILIQAISYFNTALQALLWIRILMSWFQPRSYGRDSRWFFQAQDVVVRLTEPFLAPIRNILPMSGMGIDFSPIIAAFLFGLVARVLITLVVRLPF